MRLKEKIALVTGASRGIGRAVALKLAEEGAHVVAVARTVGGLEELDDQIRAKGGSATLVPLDLLDPTGIEQLGTKLYERYRRLDVLVGNAALLGTLSPLGQIDPKVWDEVMNVNVTCNWRLIRVFDPLLRQSDAGRAIFVTSGASAGTLPYFGLYAASKAALEAMVKTWAGEITKTKIKANLLSPGVVRTAMRAHAFPGEDPMTLTPPEAIAEKFIELALPSCQRHGEVVRAQG
ncbi:MAG: SDR family NAD(P)-dependent oxidoreductase [Proteobacteria bacterium]|nr:SDR family NAD(P)-dependent oxidoreductase [Pseudomonadota bacterium]MBI3497837.1 SDR family NAD(P)-dependent oxidoreductase [Pseudomonadota bacterium]